MSPPEPEEEEPLTKARAYPAYPDPLPNFPPALELPLPAFHELLEEPEPGCWGVTVESAFGAAVAADWRCESVLFDVNAFGESVEVVGMDGFCITPRRRIGRRCVLRGGQHQHQSPSPSAPHSRGLDQHVACLPSLFRGNMKHQAPQSTNTPPPSQKISLDRPGFASAPSGLRGDVPSEGRLWVDSSGIAASAVELLAGLRWMNNGWNSCRLNEVPMPQSRQSMERSSLSAALSAVSALGSRITVVRRICTGPRSKLSNGPWAMIWSSSRVARATGSSIGATSS